MDYISFGNGKDTLIMLPRLGDGLTTVRGMAAMMAVTYRMYAKDYKVYVFSRFLIQASSCISYAACEEAKDFHQRVLAFLRA